MQNIIFIYGLLLRAVLAFRDELQVRNVPDQPVRNTKVKPMLLTDDVVEMVLSGSSSAQFEVGQGVKGLVVCDLSYASAIFCPCAFIVLRPITFRHSCGSDPLTNVHVFT